MATNENPSMTFLDDTNIHIITQQPGRIPSPSHEQTPVQFGPSDTGDRGRWTREHERDLYTYAICNDWEKAQRIFHEFPVMIRIPLMPDGSTALHVAVNKKSNAFARELVLSGFMTPQDLEISDAGGHTAFCTAAISGNSDVLPIMIAKNERLPLIPGRDGMLPVHLAALSGHHKVVQHLSSEDHLMSMEVSDIKRLFFITIHGSMYDVAIKLLDTSPTNLAASRDEKDLTAFHVLARKPSKEFIRNWDKEEEACTGGYTLLQKLWSHVSQLDYRETLISKPSPISFEAVKSGNYIFVKWLLWCNPTFVMQKYSESDDRTLLHLAALYRQDRILNYLLNMRESDLIKRAMDKDHNNVLHFAAQQPANLEGRSSGSSSLIVQSIQMRKELAWFQELESKFPPELRTMKNSEGMTPNDIFYRTLSNLYKDLKDAATGALNSGMVVAILVASVAFAAALTVTGDKNNAWFNVFMLSNAVAFFASCASIISFLSIFTSSKFTQSEFITILSLHPSLILGLALLFISIFAMVIAFAAAFLAKVDHVSKSVAYVVASLGFVPILVFLGLHL